LPADKLFIEHLPKRSRGDSAQTSKDNIKDDHMEVYWNMKKQMLRFVLFFAAVLGLICYPEKKAFASAPTTNEIQVIAVAYSDESIIIKNNDNTKIYFASEADASRDKWDVIECGTDKFTVIDFSYLSSSAENILKIKGDKDPTPERIIINKRPQKLAISINYSTFDNTTVGELLNIQSTEGDGEKPITINDLEWKKGPDGEWLDATYLKTALLKRYLLKGTVLYFRIAALNDVAAFNPTTLAPYTIDDFRDEAGSYSYKNSFEKLYSEKSIYPEDLTFISFPNGTKGRRAGSEVKLKINKQAVTPVVNVNGSKFTMAIKYGQEYRISTDGGASYGGWTKVTDTLSKPLKLKDMLKDGSDGLTDPFPAMMIDVRDYSTAKAASSRIVTTNIPEQRTIAGSVQVDTPAVADGNIYVSYNGNKNIIVTIPYATENEPYEYAVVKSGNVNDFDVDRATWTAISKNTPVKIASTKAVDGSMIFFRKKEIKYKAATSRSTQVNFQLASTYVNFKVTYPSIPAAPKKTYVYTKGTLRNVEIIVPLNEVGKNPFETKAVSVKLGTKEIPFTLSYSPALPESMSNSVVNYMKITLSGADLDKMANSNARALYIYYEKGTVDKTSSKLTIKNPTPAGKLFFTPVAGTAPNTTLVNLTSSIAPTNRLMYTFTADKVSSKNQEDAVDGSYTILDPTNTIDTTGKAGQWLTVYEVTIPAAAGDPSYIVNYGDSVQLTDEMIAK
jgi:hypothetical protein